MNVTATDRFTVAHAADLYGLDGWGNGYLRISADGHLVVTPDRNPERGVDVFSVVQQLRGEGLRTPLLLRFPQLLRAQVENLAGAFEAAIREFDYPQRFLPVFPVKVNQQRPVVDALLESGWRHGMGLEVGSRPELMAAVAQPTPPESLIVCNGFKDAEYLSTASLAVRMGKRVAVVVEKPFELEPVFEMASRGEVLPIIGFRIRLQARGSGLWEKSGGFASKFGLTTRQLLDALALCEQHGILGRVQLLHFHVGSQVTEIRKVKAAVREGGRVYAKLVQRGVPIAYVDVGGGLGIDYDGSKTSSDASVNYTVQEYANDIIFGFKEICVEESVPPPALISESGRMLAAYHAVLVTDVQAAVGVDSRLPKIEGGEAAVVGELAEVEHGISVKNYREFYHDAIEYRDRMHSLFSLGKLSLEDRAKGESLFWAIARKAVRHSKTAKFVADEFQELESQLHAKYICNFSVFQSLPDHWALDQLFPVLPIHRLDEAPRRRVTLVDITCDSDGSVEKFVDLKDIKESLEVHDLVDGAPYYLGFVLVGAYQDTMGDMHNLFGRVNEAEVVLGQDGAVELRRLRPGEEAADVLRQVGFEERDLIGGVQRGLSERVAGGMLSEADAAQLLEDYRGRLRRYTYLQPGG
jgi:arginine decarboxylase